MRAPGERNRMRAVDAARPAAPKSPSLSLETSVVTLSGIGPKRAAALAERGIATLRDLIFHLPSRYQDWRHLTPLGALVPGTVATVEAELGGISERPMRGAPWRRLASGWLSSGATRIRVVWFNLPGYMRGKLPSGERVLAHGRVTETPEGDIEIVQPEIHLLSTGSPPPVRPYYNLPAGMSQRVFAGIARNALGEVEQQVGSSIPDEVHHDFLSVAQALSGLHQPSAGADVGALNAECSPEHLSLAFDELFAFELALSLERERAAQRPGIAIERSARKAGAWLTSLPFRLTGAQARAIGEISADL